jgi:serine/threonine protein kinase
MILEHFELNTKEFEFIEKIREGSYGIVWKAKWKGMGGNQIVAIKQMNIMTFITNDLIKDFEKEASILW